VQQSSFFTRDHRLNRPCDYKFVFKNPTKISSRYFTVLAKSNGLPHARLGLAISKKVAKKAVTRNYIKRLIRESFRINSHHIENLDIVFIARKGAESLPISSKNTELFVPIWEKLYR